MGTMQCVEDLRSVYRQPGRGPIDKVIHQLDQHCEAFLAQSPLFVLSTASAEGVCDGSPKGGPPGFVQVLDTQHVAWADFSGNNRLDSFQNVVDNPSAALLFMIPGLDETLRLNGTVELTTDPALCQRMAINDKPARVVAVFTVIEAYIHCPKALHRSQLWSPASWPAEDDLPSATRMIRDHVGLDVDLATIEQGRQRDLEKTLWEPGGSNETAAS
ncbi:MAG: pyridoxamine 5'-phosphate oxidase family protein [Actinomycetia bacterium]|nr:pyridoxamine 5'-phosphate oxidase family protein [Actinomycetes bacterium]MCP5035029.1 pyridoxamine 5'-phosphate oxidase family protein [Actinomycetes bacterium]